MISYACLLLFPQIGHHDIYCIPFKKQKPVLSDVDILWLSVFMNSAFLSFYISAGWMFIISEEIRWSVCPQLATKQLLLLRICQSSR